MFFCGRSSCCYGRNVFKGIIELLFLYGRGEGNPRFIITASMEPALFYCASEHQLLAFSLNSLNQTCFMFISSFSLLLSDFSPVKILFLVSYLSYLVLFLFLKMLGSVPAVKWDLHSLSDCKPNYLRLGL